MTTETQGPAELRAAYERAIAENKTLQKQLESLTVEVKGSRIAKAGFPEGTPGHRFLADFYDGDLSDVQAMQARAKEYGHTPDSDDSPPVVRPTADRVEAGDQQLGRVRAAAQQVQQPVGSEEQLVEAIQVAESEGRWPDAISLKNELHRIRHNRVV